MIITQIIFNQMNLYDISYKLKNFLAKHSLNIIPPIMLCTPCSM